MVKILISDSLLRFLFLLKNSWWQKAYHLLPQKIFFLVIFGRCQSQDTDLWGDLSASMLTQMVISWWEDNGQSSGSAECQTPTWLCAVVTSQLCCMWLGWGGQLCPPCQLCPGCQPCLCSRAVDGWKHSSVLLLASWMACPWVLGWKLLLSIFFSSFSHFLVDSGSRNCYFQFFHLAFFSGHCLLLNTQRSLTTLLL